jgi:hypothetical protein
VKSLDTWLSGTRHGCQPLASLLIAFNVEQDSQIAFDDHGIYDFAVVGAEPMNLVGTQTGVEGVLPKDLPNLTNALFLRILQVVETSPELFGGLVPVGP